MILSFVFCFCQCFFFLFLSQLHSALSVVCYYARGQEIGKYCPTLTAPLGDMGSRHRQKYKPCRQLRINRNGLIVLCRMV